MSHRPCGMSGITDAQASASIGSGCMLGQLASVSESLRIAVFACDPRTLVCWYGMLGSRHMPCPEWCSFGTLTLVLLGTFA